MGIIYSESMQLLITLIKKTYRLSHPGERRVVLVPSEFGYGRNGIYPPETPGEPRFIIGPNTLLVYEVELLAEG